MNLARLREARLKRGFTQEYMASELGFKSRSSYCFIENGETSISVETANKIAKILEIPKDEILDVFFDGNVASAGIPACNSQ